MSSSFIVTKVKMSQSQRTKKNKPSEARRPISAFFARSNGASSSTPTSDNEPPSQAETSTSKSNESGTEIEAIAEVHQCPSSPTMNPMSCSPSTSLGESSASNVNTQASSSSSCEEPPSFIPVRVNKLNMLCFAIIYN